MTELDPGLKELIAATQGDGPSDRQRRRLQAAVLVQVSAAALTASSEAAAVTATTAISAAAAVGVATAPAVGVGAAAGGGVAVGATAAGGSLAAFAAKLVAIGAVVAGVGTGGYTVVTGHLPGRGPGHGSDLVAIGATANPEAMVAVGATADGLSAVGAKATAPAVVRPVALPDPSPPASDPPVAPVNPPPAEAPAKVEPVAVRVRPAPTRPVSAPAAAVDTFEEETAALGTALSGLRSGQPAAALAALDEQDTHFRKGALGEERAVARIETLCALGRTREAGERATRFLAQHPGSLQAARVRASCGAPKSQ